MEKRNILAWLGFGDPLGREANELYGRVVTAARRPALYGPDGVPDTPEGRYEMVALHLVLLIERLKGGGEKGAALSQRVAETFVTDMDDCLREMGVGDLAVPKKVKKAAGGLFDRVRAYRPAAAIPGEAPDRVAALAAAFSAAIPGLQDPLPLAGYAAAMEQSLAGQDIAAILAGVVVFPERPPGPEL